MIYKIPLKRPGQQEIFESQRDNVLRLTVKSKPNNILTKPCAVQLCMSKEAMLDFGKELIRNALREEHLGDITHFYPARPGEGLIVSYGIIIHPESAEPLIGHDELGTIDKNLKE